MRLIITVTLLSLLSWPRLNLAPTAYADVPEVASHTAQEGVPIELLTLGVVEAADRWGADEYAMLRAATSAGLWLRVDGDQVVEVAWCGQKMRDGVWLNPWPAPNHVTVLGELHEFTPRAVMLIGGGLEQVGDRCSVTCAGGWFACCSTQDNGDKVTPICRCRRQGSTHSDCQAGGPGSSTCELGG